MTRESEGSNDDSNPLDMNRGVGKGVKNLKMPSRHSKPNPAQQPPRNNTPTALSQEDATSMDKVFQNILDQMAGGSTQDAYKAIRGLHPGDIARLLMITSASMREAIVRELADDLPAETLSYLGENTLEEIVSYLSPAHAARILTRLSVEDAAYVLDQLDPDALRQMLDRMDPDNRQMVETNLRFPEETAGRLMSQSYLTVPPFWTLEEVIEYIKEANSIPENIFYVYIVDRDVKPIGKVLVLDILRYGSTGQRITDIADPQVRTIPALMDQAEAAYLFRQYRLMSAPVINRQGKMIGLISIDDVLEIVETEAEEDILRLGGVGEGEEISKNVKQTLRQRFAWLMTNLVTAVMASSVIGMFSSTIEQMVVLAALMPIVASMGGNAGTQALTVTVRAIATKELTEFNRKRFIKREISVALVNGIMFGTMLGLATYALYRDVHLALILSAAILVNLLTAGLAGILVPLTIQRWKLDPALGSGVFVTMLTDMVGFFVFLGLAAIYLTV